MSKPVVLKSNKYGINLILDKDMDFEDMNCFVPEMDILASLHEKGSMRMFMS